MFRKIIGITLLLILASIASLPFFIIGEDPKAGCCGGKMPVTHDSWMHFNQMQAFAEGLESGRIYPRWDEKTHGYGAPTTSFYPPGIYYVTSALYFLTRNWLLTLAGFYWLAMAASALSLYYYARRAMSHQASLVAAAVYVFAPYHLLNQYQRGAMGEFSIFIWIPLMLLFAEEILGRDHMSRQNIAGPFAGLAASFGAFLWTHPPTAYQFILVFGSLLLIQAILRRRWWAIFILVCALIFGSMLSAAYFFPAIAEQHLVNYDDVERMWPYHASYVFDFDQKVYDRIADPFFTRLDRIWGFNLALILCGIAPFAIFRKRLTVHLPSLVRIWGAAGIAASFMMTRYSVPIDALVPKIEIGVFSWRMLAITSFSMALVAGALVDLGRADRDWGRWRPVTGTIPIIALLATIAMTGWYVVWPMWRAQSFEPNPDHYNYATLPRGAPRDVPQIDLVQTASREGVVVIERWSPELRQIRIEFDEPDQLQFRTFDFPGWTAEIDGKPADIMKGAVGNIVIDVPDGLHRVTLEFRSTPVRRLSNWITVIAILLLVLMAGKAMATNFRNRSKHKTSRLLCSTGIAK